MLQRMLPENLLIPDLRNIVFEYANAHEIEGEELKTVMETIKIATERKVSLYSCFLEKIRVLNVDTIDVLKSVVKFDPHDLWLFFKYNNYFALYTTYPFQMNKLADLLVNKPCITNTAFGCPDISGITQYGFMMLTHFQCSNDDSLESSTRVIAWK